MWGPINILEETLELKQKKYRWIKERDKKKKIIVYLHSPIVTVRKAYKRTKRQEIRTRGENGSDEGQTGCTQWSAEESKMIIDAKLDTNRRNRKPKQKDLINSFRGKYINEPEVKC